ncbi:MAG: hypothetical protein IJG45_02880 [Oscillospiraceae bacterium]|nr:hypothetical protein [Oscillospiraceae bacterium]
MRNARKSIFHRLLALAMVCVMVLGVLPIPQISAETTGHPDAVTITVVDGDGALEGATVAYTLTDDATGAAISNVMITGSDGIVEILSAEEFGETSYSLRANVSCDFHETDDALNEQVTSYQDNFIVTLHRSVVPGITVTPTAETYSDGAGYPAVTVSGTQEGDTITITVDGKETVLNEEGSNMPTISKAATYSVTVKVERANYEDFSATVDSVISPAQIEGADVKVQGVNTEYTGEPQQLITITGADAADYQYEIRLEGEETVYHNPEDLTRTNAGEYRVLVTAKKENYEPLELAPVDAVIGKKQQTPPGFNNIEYEDKGELTLELGEITEPLDFSAWTESETFFLTYRLENEIGGPIADDGDAIASISGNGLLTVKSAGSMKIIAALSGDDNHATAEICFYLNVVATQNLLKPMDDVNYIFGAANGVASAQQAKTAYEKDTGTVTYAFEDAQNAAACGLEIDASNGKITIADYSKLNDALRGSAELSFVVQAAKAAVEGTTAKTGERYAKYAAASTNYTLIIGYALPDEAAVYALYADEDGSQPAEPNKAGWYNNNLYLIPAPGYEAATKINKEGSDFANNVLLEENGNLTIDVYLRNDKGEILAPIENVNVKLDTVLPTDLEVIYLDPLPQDGLLTVLTLNFYQSEAQVELRAKDEHSGVDCFVWRYVREDGVSGVNSEATDWSNPVPAEYDEKTGTYSATIALTEEIYGQMRGHVEFYAVDIAGNGSEENACTGEAGFVIDTLDPELLNGEISFNEPHWTDGTTAYYNEAIVGTVTICENNFIPDDFAAEYNKNGLTGSLEMTWDVGTDTAEGMVYVGTFTIGAPTDHSGDGAYVISIRYRDRSGNEEIAYTSYKKVIDTTDPALSVSYLAPFQEANAKSYYNSSIRGEITIDETNFFASYVTATCTGSDGAQQKLTVNWVEVDGKHVGKFIITADTEEHTADSEYTVTVVYQDPTKENVKLTDTSGILVLDTLAPEELQLAYVDWVNTREIAEEETVYIYNETAKVQLSAKDSLAGVEYFMWRYVQTDDASTSNAPTTEWAREDAEKQEDGSFAAIVELEKNVYGQMLGRIEFYSVDFADNGNDASTACRDESRSFMLDSEPLLLDVNYQKAVAEKKPEGELPIEYFVTDIEVTLVVKKIDFVPDDLTVVVKKDGDLLEQAPEIEWKNTDADNTSTNWAGTFIIPADMEDHTADGVYTVSVSYNDLSGNGMYAKDFTQEEYPEEPCEYLSETTCVLILDTTDPLLNGVRYNEAVQQLGGKDYYNGNIEGTIEIEETNFYEDDVVATFTKDGGDPQKLAVNWKVDDGKHIGRFTIQAENNHTADGEYVFSITMKDRSGETLTDPDHTINSNVKVLDTKAPSGLMLAYLDPVVIREIKEDPADKDSTVIEADYYYQETADVKLVAKDETAGVEYFVWRYVRREGVSELNAPTTEWARADDVVKQEDGSFAATVSLGVREKEYKNGHVEFYAVDRSMNGNDETTAVRSENAENEDDEKLSFFVLDSTDPLIAGVDYSAANRIASDKDYYNGPIDVTITLEEVNFDPSLYRVYYVKDENDEQPMEVECEWRGVDDQMLTLEGTFTLPADADHSNDGDYVIYIAGADISTNIQEDYTESRIKVIDTTPPEIVLQESRQEDLPTQTVTITITEHNFNAGDIVLDLTAKDINGNDVSDIDALRKDVIAALTNPTSWQDDQNAPDVHVLVLNKELKDAVYSMKLSYSDLAEDKNAEKQKNTDQKTIDFTIDRTKPDAETFTISYSDPILPTGIDPSELPPEYEHYNYYNDGQTDKKPLVVITVTGNDVTSGISTFHFGYQMELDASTINVEKLILDYEAVAAEEDKSLFTASMILPQDVADQFRGNIYVTATDNKKNTSDAMTDEGTVIVIDSKAPTVTEEYGGESAVVGSDHYYNGDAILTLIFNEANFYEEDVKIAVNRETGDGNAAPSQASVTWNYDDAANDNYVAKITISALANGGGDGHYTVTAEYTDRSNNKMESYASERITIDTTAPTISVRYDNNELTDEHYFGGGTNNKYFKANRQATITIVEHNFNESKVTLSLAGGASFTGWSTSGDTHTAMVAYTTDGDYTFDISMKDIAENSNSPVDYGGSAAPQSFTIDTKTKMITIDPESVENGKAYIYDDELIPSFTITDTNLEGYKVTLVGVQKGGTIDLSDKVEKLIERSGNTATALLDIFEKKVELDGIYTLTVRSTDLSDNYDEQSVRFTMNRFGSVYEYSDELLALIEDGGTFNQKIDEDLTFTIYNASPIDEDNVVVLITRDGVPVEADYAVSEVATDGESWYTYLVTINKDNYAADGIYTISITTTDDSGGEAVENGEANSDGDILFIVDSTAPQLQSVAGLEEKIVNTTELTVNYDVFDTGGLASVKVLVDGAAVVEITEFEDASKYSGNFTISEKSSAQHVCFILTDKAGNVTSSDTADFAVPYALERDVTVSTNLFVRWFANKPLFFGSIGGVALLAGAGALLKLKRRKKVVVE